MHCVTKTIKQSTLQCPGNKPDDCSDVSVFLAFVFWYHSVTEPILHQPIAFKKRDKDRIKDNSKVNDAVLLVSGWNSFLLVISVRVTTMIATQFVVRLSDSTVSRVTFLPFLFATKRSMKAVECKN